MLSDIGRATSIGLSPLLVMVTPASSTSRSPGPVGSGTPISSSSSRQQMTAING